ncbi:NAD(P)H-dependent oxidoreductase [Belliella sp. DSM 111904]|uniref:NAD(P)H-dependent oxidoreductase n=1 Tax=Belliella filtrata TaxID=2923435 RepID=A0ABS9V1P4_9BACT|nr:NAD(P)H-dependent oxidoreductase [Belliella filtrata]MCH7410347.1 NAD(P)H-dependent oxidoreductase [Belliella filtrata]
MKGIVLKIYALVFLQLISIDAFSQEAPFVLVAYYSQSGKTKSMAEAVAKGVSAQGGVGVVLKDIKDVLIEEVTGANAIILGSPVYNANMAPEVQEFINSWPFEGRMLKDKFGAVFVTGGGFSIGEEAVMFSMIRAMMIHGMIIVGGDTVEASFGASAITGEGEFEGRDIADLFLEKATGLGNRVAELIAK